MRAWLQLVLLLATPRSPEPSLHKVDVHIAGPLAMVEVWRTVEANTRTVGDRQQASYLDLGLPEGAALLDWEAIDRDGRTRLVQQTEVQVNAGLATALKLRRLALPATPVEEGAAYRVHITPISDGETAILHYRYATVVGCRAGRLVLRMPENLEEDPVPAEVTVTIAPLPDGLALAEASLANRPEDIRPGARRVVMHGTAPARAPWEISWRYARRLESFPGQVLAAAARVPRMGVTHGRTKAVPQYELAGLVCRDEGPAKAEVPKRVLLLVDRSRSVGPGGLSAERALARGLVEALPPSVQFNAIAFGVEASPVFALPRLPTREALEIFTSAADPNRLENGTDIALALARTRSMLDNGGDDGAGPTWVVLLTDGALPASQSFERMQKALAGTSEQQLKVLVLLLRQMGDDDVPADAIAEYAHFARKFGGIVRVIPPGNVEDTARGLLAAMARGGDLLDVRLERGKIAEVLSPGQGGSIAFIEPASAAGQKSGHVMGDEAPGRQGATREHSGPYVTEEQRSRPGRIGGQNVPEILTGGTRLPRERLVRFSARALASDVHAETTPAPVKQEWLEPLLDIVSGKRRAWSGANGSMVIAVLPVAVATKKTSDEVVRGRMDPAVLRNALSLAFMPRARACYLSRRVAKAGDAYLHGRMRLELTIERGELHDAVVRNSTLGNPQIENCVRSAAWAVEYPRPEHRDAPTTANVNLVFRPHTPEETPPDASPIDREIELILGPLTFPVDFKDLIDDKVPSKSPSQ